MVVGGVSADDEFGARCLAELRRLGAGLDAWKYETVVQLEKATRAQFVELFKRASPRPTYALIQQALSDEPEVLARRLLDARQMDGLLPIILFSF